MCAITSITKLNDTVTSNAELSMRAIVWGSWKTCNFQNIQKMEIIICVAKILILFCANFFCKNGSLRISFCELWKKQKCMEFAENICPIFAVFYWWTITMVAWFLRKLIMAHAPVSNLLCNSMKVSAKMSRAPNTSMRYLCSWNYWPNSLCQLSCGTILTVISISTCCNLKLLSNTSKS